MTDSEMLLLLKRNPEIGMNMLINEYSSLLYAVVKAKFNNSDYYSSDIEDCVSDTFVKFYVELDKYKPNKGSIRAYLCIIARSMAMDLARKRSTERKYAQQNEEETSGEEYFSVEADYLKEELVSEILREVSQLGYPDREIIIRKFYLSQTAEEIADALNVSIANVNVRAHRAIKRLRKKFGGEQ